MIPLALQYSGFNLTFQKCFKKSFPNKNNGKTEGKCCPPGVIQSNFNSAKRYWPP